MDDNDIVYEDFSDFPNYARELHKYTKSTKNNKVQGLLVELYNLDGQLLGSFNSIAEASRETEIPQKIISICCYFNRRIGDKIFIFKDDSFEDKKREIEANKYGDGSIIKRNSIWIKEYSLNGTAITYWNTPLEAAKAYGIRAHDISRCLKGERLTVGGKIFLPLLEPISKRLNKIKRIKNKEMKDNCPPLMQSEEARAPWNEKEPTSVQVDCTVCYCMSKFMPVEVHIHNDSFKDVNFIEEFKNDNNALGIPTLLQELQRLSGEKIEQLRTEGLMLDENDKKEEKRILKQIKYYQAIQKASEDWVVDDLDVCQE